jgi:hypothetical protein
MDSSHRALREGTKRRERNVHREREKGITTNQGGSVELREGASKAVEMRKMLKVRVLSIGP